MIQHRIPLSEIEITFARSGGPGGQHVNKTSTKAIIRWSIGKSTVFSVEEKARIRMVLASRLTIDDDIVLHVDEERSQLSNKEQAVRRLQSLVARALVIPKKRHPTRPTRGSVSKRLHVKKRRSVKKHTRRTAGEE